MTVAFVCNKDLTVPFEGMARHLRAQGEKVVWLSPSSRWSRWLGTRGWPAADILNLPDQAARWHAMTEDQARETLVPFEVEPTATAAHIIRMCRSLDSKPPALGYAYLAVAASAVDAFLQRHGVSAIFGEGTWGFELAIWLAATRRGIPMTRPATTRLPADRMCLVDALDGSLLTDVPAGAEDEVAARDYYDRWVSQPRPAQGAVVESSGLGWIQGAWLRELKQIARRRDDDRDDETLWPLHRRVADRLRQRRWERSTRRFLRRQPSAPAAPYVLYCMHHQPEASIDVMGAFHHDQAHLIETLARMLPATHRLHIREHRGAWGDRSAGWYERVKHLPGIVFVDPFEPVWDQVRGASATISVTGTVLFESALLGVPALGLGPIHFAPMLAVPATRRSSPLAWPLRDIIDADQRERWVPNEAAKIAFLAHLFANSAIGDPAAMRKSAAEMTDPDWMRPEAAFLTRMLPHLPRRSTVS